MEELIFELRVERLKAEKLRREWTARRALHDQELDDLRSAMGACQEVVVRERRTAYEEGRTQGRAEGYREAEERLSGRIEELEKQVSQLCELQHEKEGLCDELE